MMKNSRHIDCIICFIELSGVFPPEIDGMHHLKQVWKQARQYMYNLQHTNLITISYFWCFRLRDREPDNKLLLIRCGQRVQRLCASVNSIMG